MFDLDQAIAEWRQMIAAGIKAPVPLDELEGHLRDDIEEQMRSGLTAPRAFEAAVERIGQAHALKLEFTKAGETKGDDMINHNRMYSAVLAIFTVLTAVNAIGLLMWQRSVGGPIGHLPEWTVPWMIALNFAYSVAMGVTLFARRYRPESGRRLTWLLNWALLPALPGGTVLGVYGLWAVDKEETQYV